MSGDRVISPKLEDLDTLRPPLEPGERTVLDFFNRNLDPAWEIYLQPHLNGLRPDFVLLNPKIGVAVFEVKDWDLDAQTYSPGQQLGRLRVRDPETGNSFQKRSPLDQVRRYRDEIRTIYCPGLGHRLNLPLVTSGVIFTKATTKQAHALCDPELEKTGTKGHRYWPVTGADALRSNDIDQVFPESTRKSSFLMKDELASDLRRWLVEPDHSREQRTPPKLDRQQTTFASSRTRSGFRRIRGPAGSGKTLVLAARAAQLAEEGRSVLVISYNITLLNYLQDMFVRFGRPRNSEHLTWLHFHGWCKRTMLTAGCSEEHDLIWKERDDSDHKLDVRLPDETQAALAHGPFRREVPTYDAILVDEGQDILPSWWDALRCVLNPGGEMVLVADRAQDVYGRNSNWTDQAMDGAGFSGPWSELNRSYRTPSHLRELLGLFERKFNLDGTDVLSSPPQTELQLCELHWRQVGESELVSTLAASFREIDNPAISDITFIVDNKDLGLELVSYLEAEKMGNVTHTFHPEKERERALKQAFFKGSGRVKVTTIQSFKGWECPALIVGIKLSDPAVVYTAISRLKQVSDGSHLHVVCADGRYAGYGTYWNQRATVS